MLLYAFVTEGICTFFFAPRSVLIFVSSRIRQVKPSF